MFVLSTFGYHLYGITDHPHRYILLFIKVLFLILPNFKNNCFIFLYFYFLYLYLYLFILKYYT